MRPLLRLVRAHNPSRSAALSARAVSATWARPIAGSAQSRSAQIRCESLGVVVMSALYPRCADSEPLHSPVEIRAIGLQPARCVRDVAARFRQRARDHRALERVETL